MNKTIKSLFSSVLILAMVFSAFSMIVSADTTATITVTEEDAGVVTVTGSLPVKKLVFKVQTPEKVKVATTCVNLSWDSADIAPVYNVDGYTDTFDVDAYPSSGAGSYAGFAGTVSTGAFPPTANLKYLNACGDIVKVGDRYALDMGTYIQSDYSFDSTTAVTFTEFYFVVKDGATVDADTFKVETDYTTGGVLDALWDEPAANVAGIVVENYRFGNADKSIADTATFGGFPYGSKTETVNVSEVEIADVTKTYDGTAATATIEVPTGVKATIAYEGGAAPVNAGTYTATATLTAEEGYELTGVENADLEATIIINKKAVTFTVADATKKEGEADPTFTGAFADGDIVDGDTYEVAYSVDENNKINANVAISDNYAVTVVPGTLTITEVDPVKENLTEVTGVKELEINGKIYKDLYMVKATISEGFIGKKITKYGVSFEDATEGATKGGAKVEVTPGTAIVLEDGGKLEFSAAVIGVPETVTSVRAIPFVWFK